MGGDEAYFGGSGGRIIRNEIIKVELAGRKESVARGGRRKQTS